MTYVYATLIGSVAGGYLSWRFRGSIQSVVDWLHKSGPPLG